MIVIHVCTCYIWLKVKRTETLVKIDSRLYFIHSEQSNVVRAELKTYLIIYRFNPSHFNMPLTNHRLLIIYITPVITQNFIDCSSLIFFLE